ncbi:MAG: 16S rRNA (cytosine(1402)-N(4))-methyltransferase RsmH [Alphaproteobacteria bacterium]|nr:16S rRNA (cytosine(1402)-N(4))-methyltransferase RsmH [Alphaproteobacteria bacterium]
MQSSPHIPVMLNEVLENLNIKDGGVYIDGTFGNGGYTSAILDKANTKVISFDRDSTVLPRVEEVKKKYGNRFVFFQECFSKILPTLQQNGIGPVDGLVLDIGVSSMQIDTPERGFSFRFDAPLSMAMGQNDLDAKEVINNFSETELADIFYKYGEEPRSRAIAKRIVSKRGDTPITTTFQLVDVIKNLVGEWQASKIIPRIFQALRIYVNNELGELEQVLSDTENILSSGGRLVVVDFHSLEDRIVKNFIKSQTEPKQSQSRYIPINIEENKKLSFKNVNKNAIIPSAEEVERNPRAHSAKLRVMEKL